MTTINSYINRIQHNITVHYTDQYHSIYLQRSWSYITKLFYWKLESMTTKKRQFHGLNSDTFQGNKRWSVSYCHSTGYFEVYYRRLASVRVMTIIGSCQAHASSLASIAIRIIGLLEDNNN